MFVSKHLSNFYYVFTVENSTRKSGNNNSSRIHPNSGLSETDNSQELELLSKFDYFNVLIVFI